MIERIELAEEARSVGIPETLAKRLYDEGWRDAMNVTERNRLRESEKRSTALVSIQGKFQQQIDEALAVGRHEGFQDGLQTGLARARPHERAGPTQAPPRLPPSAPVRDSAQILEQVEAQCRIIAESNPGMAPAINALRHRLKKVQ